MACNVNWDTGVFTKNQSRKRDDQLRKADDSECLTHPTASAESRGMRDRKDPWREIRYCVDCRDSYKPMLCEQTQFEIATVNATIKVHGQSHRFALGEFAIEICRNEIVDFRARRCVVHDLQSLADRKKFPSFRLA